MPRRIKKIIAIALAALLTLLFVICTIISSNLSKTLISQQTGELFMGEGETPYAQVSVFFPISDELGVADIYTFRQALDKKFVEASIEAEGTQVLYMDAYSGKSSIRIEGSRGSATASVTGVGGDFFQFHQLYLRSGSYISDSDLMKDRVILDEELAWRIFGGIDLAGEAVNIGGERYIIAGVISREDDFASEKAYTDGMGLFMSYEALERLDENVGINCYEIVCINPVTGFASGILEDNFEKGAVVENSDRFSVESIWNVAKAYGERSMNNEGIIYPYWENAARLIEDYMALCLVLQIIFGSPVAIALIAIGVYYWIRFYRSAKRRVPILLNDRREAAYAKKSGISSEASEAAAEEKTKPKRLKLGKKKEQDKALPSQEKIESADTHKQTEGGEKDGKCDTEEYQESV